MVNLPILILMLQTLVVIYFFWIFKQALVMMKPELIKLVKQAYNLILWLVAHLPDL
jgi:hypothetical protein